MTRTVAQVLWYLTLRVVVNSIRRAFANPFRAVLTTFRAGVFPMRVGRRADWLAC
jgi:hypothetical protein